MKCVIKYHLSWLDVVFSLRWFTSQLCHAPRATMTHRLMSKSILRSSLLLTGLLSEKMFSLALSYINSIWRKAVIKEAGQGSQPSHHPDIVVFFFFPLSLLGTIFQYLQMLSEAKTQVSGIWSKRRMFFSSIILFCSFHCYCNFLLSNNFNLTVRIVQKNIWYSKPESRVVNVL